MRHGRFRHGRQNQWVMTILRAVVPVCKRAFALDNSSRMGLSSFLVPTKGGRTVEGSQAPDPKALAKLFEGLDDPAARRRFMADPSVATGELPPKVQKFFSDLTDEELRVLVRTWKKMKDAGLTYDMDGVTVSFL
jgi:hypothetical protein